MKYPKDSGEFVINRGSLAACSYSQAWKRFPRELQLCGSGLSREEKEKDRSGGEEDNWHNLET